MNKDKTIVVIITLALAGAAGYVYGGLHWAVISVIAAGAAVCWKYA